MTVDPLGLLVAAAVVLVTEMALRRARARRRPPVSKPDDAAP
jgi:hypothetical protein